MLIKSNMSNSKYPKKGVAYTENAVEVQKIKTPVREGCVTSLDDGKSPQILKNANIATF